MAAAPKGNPVSYTHLDVYKRQALTGRDRTRATLEMKVETMRPALAGEAYRLRGDVVRMARQVAYSEATVIDGDDRLVSRSTGTFLLHRHADARSTIDPQSTAQTPGG